MMASLCRSLLPIAGSSSRQASVSAPLLGSGSGSRQIHFSSRVLASRAAGSFISPEAIEALQPREEPDAWWRSTGISSYVRHTPNDHYSGRSIPVVRNKGFTQAYRILSSVLSRTGVRKDARIAEFYERPCFKRQRLSSERHRRRFQEMVRTKVHTVQALRNRR